MELQFQSFIVSVPVSWYPSACCNCVIWLKFFWHLLLIGWWCYEKLGYVMYDICDLFRISLGEREGGSGRERKRDGREEGRKKEGRRLPLSLSLSLSLLSPSIYLPLSLPTLEKRRGEKKEGSEERSILCLVIIKIIIIIVSLLPLFIIVGLGRIQKQALLLTTVHSTSAWNLVNLRARGASVSYHLTENLN